MAVAEGEEADYVQIAGIPGQSEPWWAALALEEHVKHYEDRHALDRKEAIKRTAQDRSMQKRDVYNAVMRKNESG
ncbi:hypothetical protein D3C84_1202910 [compost metagenome]